MTLRNNFCNSGNWLFRWRSYLPLAMIGVVLLTLREYQYPFHNERVDHALEIICLLISFFGLGIRIFTIGYTPKGTSGRNTKNQVADSLNTTGIYSLVRNPLYLGNFFIYLGIVLFAHLWWLTLIFILVFWLYYERIIFAEEEYLIKKFGNIYNKWANNTPAFFPRFTGYKKPNLSFSIKNALKREYNGFFAIIVVLFLLEVIGDFVVDRRFDVDLAWLVLLGIGFIAWITLRILKKHSKFLSVKGR